MMNQPTKVSSAVLTAIALATVEAAAPAVLANSAIENHHHKESEEQQNNREILIQQLLSRHRPNSFHATYQEQGMSQEHAGGHQEGRDLYYPKATKSGKTTVASGGKKKSEKGGAGKKSTSSSSKVCKEPAPTDSVVEFAAGTVCPFDMPVYQVEVQQYESIGFLLFEGPYGFVDTGFVEAYQFFTLDPDDTDCILTSFETVKTGIATTIGDESNFETALEYKLVNSGTFVEQFREGDSGDLPVPGFYQFRDGSASIVLDFSGAGENRFTTTGDDIVAICDELDPAKHY